LNRLSRLRLIDKHVPITERAERSKRSRYRIRDPYFRFWFHFVYGTGNQYEQLGDEAYEVLIEPALPDFVSHSFERLCCSALRTFYPSYTIIDTGQWWYGDHEIDVVGLTDGNTLVAGECKFQSSPLGYNALSTLQDHVDELRWVPSGGDERTCEYALFSRSGFKQSVKEAAESREDLRLYTVEDVVEALEAGI
jgi:AAA+ ATPase superfamily predicted ATPase